MNERQWLAIAVLGGVVSAMSAYSFDGRSGFYAFLVVTTALAGWVAFRRPEKARTFLGLFVFECVMIFGMPLAGLFLEGDPGNLWGLAALMGAVPSATFYLAVDWWRQRQPDD